MKTRRIPSVPDGIGEILLTPQVIENRVQELGDQISRDYASTPTPVITVGILKGCFMFLGDLCKALTVPVEVDCMSVSSYDGARTSTGRVRIIKDLETIITDRNVLIVEGIVDTGRTLHHLIGALAERQPADVKVCALLDKPARRMSPVTVDYRGFEIPDRFVVGYGLDFDQQYRQLPYVATLHDDQSQATP